MVSASAPQGLLTAAGGRWGPTQFPNFQGGSTTCSRPEPQEVEASSKLGREADARPSRYSLGGSQVSEWRVETQLTCSKPQLTLR